MAKSPEALMECETIIRWDETGEPATLWTASPKVREEWKTCGFPIAKQGRGWCVNVPKDRIVYKMYKP